METAVRRVNVANIAVIVREITVNDIRKWLVESDSKTSDIVEQMILEDFPVSDIILCSDLTEKQAGKLRPSELQEIADACKELNSHFFAFRERIINLSVLEK